MIRGISFQPGLYSKSFVSLNFRALRTILSLRRLYVESDFTRSFKKIKLSSTCMYLTKCDSHILTNYIFKISQSDNGMSSFCWQLIEYFVEIMRVSESYMLPRRRVQNLISLMSFKFNSRSTILLFGKGMAG